MATRHQLALDYAASFTPNTSAATTAMTALAVATTGTWVAAPWQIVAVGTLALTLGAYGVSRSRAVLDKPHRVPAALAATWGLWGTAVTGVIASDPHTWTLATYWAVLAGFVTIWALTWWALDRADITDEAHYAENLHAQGATPEETEVIIEALKNDRRRHELAATWVKAITDTMGFTPTVTGLTEWAPVNGTSPGFTMTIDLPRGASSQAFTTQVVRQLAEDAQLPNGCTITTGRGVRQGQLLLNVETVNAAEITHHFPRDYSPLTIHGMLPWGVTPHGAVIGPELRQKGAIIIGPPGTGKTMLLNNVIAAFARCPDVLVWGIDVGKQGAAFRHWTTDLPPGARRGVDAVAGTNTEALDMIEAAQRAADKRVHHYAAAMKAANTDLVPISAQVPQIVLIFDESAELFAYEGNDPIQKKAREAAIRLMRTARQAGVRTILTFTDGNVISVGSTDILKYNPVHVALCGGGADPQATSVAKLFGQVRGIDARQIDAPGAGVANYGRGPEIHRGWLTGPDMIAECVTQTSQHRPTLDAPTAEALGSWYTTRWDTPTTDGDPGERQNVTRTSPTHQPVTWTATDGLTDEDMAPFEEEFTGPPTAPGHGLGWLAEAAARIETPDQQPDQEPDQEPGQPAGVPVTGWRKLVLTHLADTPTQTYSTSELVQILATRYGQSIARQTLSTQLAAWAADGTITAIGSGAHRTYTHRKDRPA